VLLFVKKRKVFQFKTPHFSFRRYLMFAWLKNKYLVVALLIWCLPTLVFWGIAFTEVSRKPDVYWGIDVFFIMFIIGFIGSLFLFPFSFLVTLPQIMVPYLIICYGILLLCKYKHKEIVIVLRRRLRQRPPQQE